MDTLLDAVGTPRQACCHLPDVVLGWERVVDGQREGNGVCLVLCSHSLGQRPQFAVIHLVALAILHHEQPPQGGSVGPVLRG